MFGYARIKVGYDALLKRILERADRVKTVP